MGGVSRRALLVVVVVVVVIALMRWVKLSIAVALPLLVVLSLLLLLLPLSRLLLLVRPEVLRNREERVEEPGLVSYKLDRLAADANVREDRKRVADVSGE